MTLKVSKISKNLPKEAGFQHKKRPQLSERFIFSFGYV